MSKEFCEEPTPYQDNRAILLDRALRTKNLVSKVVRDQEEGEYTFETPPKYWNPLREDHDLKDYTVTVDRQFIKGMNTIVDSLISDLYDTGNLGREMAADIIYDIQMENARPRNIDMEQRKLEDMSG